MTDYRGRRRRPEDDDYSQGGYPPDPGAQYPPPEPDSEATSWIDRGPLAYEEQSYEQPPRRYSTEDRHYRRAAGPPPDEPGRYQPPPPDEPGRYSDEPTRYHAPPDEPTRYHAAPEEPTRYQPRADEPTRYSDEPTRYQAPPPPPARDPGPPRGAEPGPPRGAPRGGGGPPGWRPPPTDSDATVMMPRLRNAPQAPPTPIPQLRFNPADATMLMSAVPYFAPSATPAYTGTIYVSYAASRAQMEDEAAALPEAEREDAAQSVARSGAIMAVGSIVSRVTGFLRVVVLGAVIGAHLVGNTYTTSNTIPSMVYELLLGGILTSVLIPQLVRARASDPDRGQAFAQRLLTLSVLALGAATLIAVLSAPLLTAVMINRSATEAQRDLMTSLSYLLLPEVFFFGLAGVLAAVLNSRGHFAAPMWTPIFNNMVVIVTAGVFWLVSPAGAPTPATITATQVAVLGLGTTLGIVVQACGLIPALRKVGFRWRWRFDFRELHLAELGRIAMWMACYVAVSQIGVVVIVKLAYAAGNAPATDGVTAAGPFIYQNAFLLFMMAHGVVAVSIITALMPRMSAAAASGEYREVARNLSLGTRLTSVVLIPATGAYVVLAGAITSVLFRYGHYSDADAKAAAVVVAVAGLGLVPFAISQLQTFAFYALTETKTAALVNIPVVAIKVIVDIGIFYTMPARYVAAGLMVGNLISYTLGAYISARLLRSRLGPMGQGEVFRTLARLAIAGLVGVIGAWLVLSMLNLVLGDGRLSNLVRIVIGGAVLAAVYLATAWLMRVREVSDVLELVNRKLGGRLPLPSRRHDSSDHPDVDEYEDYPTPPPRTQGTVYGGRTHPGAPSYQDEPPPPRARPYRDRPPYDEPPPYPDQPPYRDQAPHPGQAPYPDQPHYPEDQPYRDEPPYRGPPRYPDAPRYPDPPSYRDDPGGYPPDPRYSEPRYRDPSYRDDRPYPDEWDDRPRR